MAKAKSKKSKKREDGRETRYVVVGDRVLKLLGHTLPSKQFVSTPHRRLSYGDKPMSQQCRLWEPEAVFVQESLAQRAVGWEDGFFAHRGEVKRCMVKPHSDGRKYRVSLDGCERSYVDGFKELADAQEAAECQLEEELTELLETKNKLAEKYLKLGLARPKALR